MPGLVIPADVLDQMVCLSCKNYLSIFPIYIKNDSSGGVCGRCKLSDEDDFIRDKAYESIAQFLTFPCSYKINGCNENLTPSKLEAHEKLCFSRKFECPIKDYTKCQWLGTRMDLLKHFELLHPTELMREPHFELNFVNSYRQASLFSFDNELFVIKKEVDTRKNIFSCSVQHLKSSENSPQYNYFLRAETMNKNYSCKTKEKSTSSANNVTHFEGDFLKEKLNEPAAIIIKVEIIKANEVMEDEESIKKNEIEKDPKINWELLAELECPVCYDFMLPPIYQCIDGHSICSGCKPNLENCPLCKRALQDTKNFTLEKLTRFLIYPCKYYKTGCNYSAKSSEIEKHELNCDFGPYDCPLSDVEKCNLKLISSEIVGHVDKNHAAFILKNDKVNIPFNKDENLEYTYLIKLLGRIFKLYFKYAEEKFYWIVQLVGSTDDCQLYRFEIDVVDNSGKRLRRYLNGLCISSAEIINNAIKDSNKYLMMPFEQAKPLITTSFSFRVRVMKD